MLEKIYTPSRLNDVLFTLLVLIVSLILAWIINKIVNWITQKVNILHNQQ